MTRTTARTRCTEWLRTRGSAQFATAATALIFALSGSGPAHALTAQEALSEKWGVPGSPTGQAVATVLEMVARGDDAYTTETLRTRFTDGFRDAFPMEQHLEIFRQLHRDLPDPRPAGVQRAGDGEARFVIRSGASGNEVTLSVLIEPGSGRIAGLQVAPGGPGGGGPGGGAGQPPESPEELRSELDRLAAADDFSGVLLIARRGEPVFLEARGLADKGARAAVGPETRFNVGSLGKALTGAVVLQLVAEGRIELDAPIERYLQGFPSGVGDRVTVRHLLRHRSGWGAYWDHPAFERDVSRLRELSQYMDFIRTIPLAFEPGSQERYSNVGYEVLGAIVEAVTGQSYPDVVRARVFEPLGMSRTCVCDFDMAREDVAVGYTNQHPAGPAEGYVRENTHLLAPRGTAAGGALSTAGDLMRFFRVLFAGEVVDDPLVELMLPDGRGAEVALAGGAPGVQAMVQYRPADDRFVAVLSNYDSPAGQRLFRWAVGMGG